ncbi:MAG TPA: TetR/AcrR family transcriptional regulator [Solirubrobacterales bacterium]|jgi:AcrR family transcriptional regulator|nr:TetR/AcrR family transcriptional regulator [Solirubrobacterales bacterium]
MAKIRTPRDAWIAAALRALAEGGPEAVRIEALATMLGVSKGGFYWHFDGRAALLEEMLDSWEQRVVGDVIAEIESEPAPPRDKLQHLFALASSASELMPIELALRDWARRDEGVAARLHRVDNRRMDYLRQLFGPICRDEDEAEARGILAFSLFIGSNFILAEHRGRSRSQVLRLADDYLLRESRADGAR